MLNLRHISTFLQTNLTLNKILVVSQLCKVKMEMFYTINTLYYTIHQFVSSQYIIYNVAYLSTYVSSLHLHYLLHCLLPALENRFPIDLDLSFTLD